MGKEDEEDNNEEVEEGRWGGKRGRKMEKRR